MKTKQTLALLLSILMLLGALSISAFADAGDNDSPFVEPPESTEGETFPEAPAPDAGLSFDSFGTYPLARAFGADVRTLEAELRLSSADNTSSGVILSNEDKEAATAYLTFSVYKRGVPRVTYLSADGISYDFRFEDVDLRRDAWVHLAITLDPAAGAIHCYVDGALAQTLTADRAEKPYVDYHPDTSAATFYLGGDATEKNPTPFPGEMRALSVFSSTRTAQQILADKAGVDLTERDLLCSYALSSDTLYDGAEDLSPNKNGLSSVREWFTEAGGTYTGDYDFSLAVVGDTQLLTYYGNSGRLGYRDTLNNLYSWIVDNAEEKKMQYVIGLGDITEKDTDDEWALAKNAITKMDGVLPYSLVRGQGHDTVPQFNKYFAEHTPFTENLGGTFREGSVANSWQEFSVGEVKYLILSLDFGATDEILAWANGIVEAHPEHRVILTTHAYLDSDATTLDKGDGYNAAGYPFQEGTDSDQPKNDGISIFNKLASKHENIFLVISGHQSADTVVMRQTKGEAGNTVTEMLIDPQTMDGQYQGGTGMVAMLYFSMDSDTVGVEYYSTNMGVYRPVQTFDINHTHAYGDTVVPPTCENYGYTAHVCTCGHALSNTNLVPKLPHTYLDEYDADCDVCGDVREVEERPVESESESASVATDGDPTESESLPERETSTVVEMETESLPAETAEETASPSPDAGKSDGDGEFPVGVIVAVSVLGGAAVLGGGGVVLWTFVFKKKK